MLSYLKKLLFDGSDSIIDDEKKLQIATCALFIEVAKSDSDFSSEERDNIIFTMKDDYSLNDEEISELMMFSEQDIKNSISYYEFTSQLDEHLSKDEKYKLIKNLWRLVYTDNKLDKYEDQLVKRLGGMLNLDFQDIIAARFEARKEIQGN